MHVKSRYRTWTAYSKYQNIQIVLVLFYSSQSLLLRLVRVLIFSALLVDEVLTDASSVT